MGLIMPRLKSETRDEHTATERTALSRAMTHGTMTVVEYKNKLVAYHAIHGAIDRGLERNSFARDIAGESAKTIRLASDLVALSGVSVRAGRAVDDALGALVGLAAELEGATLLGMVYVMEGSSLGAAILYPRIEASAALPPAALAYYRGDGARTFERWTAFGARMNAGLTDLTAQERAIATANATFSGIRGLFEAIRPECAERLASVKPRHVASESRLSRRGARAPR